MTGLAAGLVAFVAFALAAVAVRAADVPIPQSLAKTPIPPGSEGRRDGNNNATSCTLTVRVTNLQPGRRPVGLLVFDKESGFPTKVDRAMRRAWVHPDDATTTAVLITIPRLPFGRYALSAFQDLNGNRTLDRSFFGRPTEPYGFSGNPPQRFGPPRFGETAVELHEGFRLLEIRLIDGKD